LEANYHIKLYPGLYLMPDLQYIIRPSAASTYPNAWVAGFRISAFVEFGQGVASMSPALRDLEQALLEGNLAHGGHRVLSMCVSHTVIALDDAGNRKPSKRRSTAKIDGLVAMAIGVAPLQAKPIDIEALIG
jgi:phage terminase large subunit-like protein